MTRLVDPISTLERKLAPGESVFWTTGLSSNRLNILYFDTLDEAMEELFKVMKCKPDNTSKATVNYKTEDGEFLEIIHVQFYRYKKQKSLGEWISGWFNFNKEVNDE